VPRIKSAKKQMRQTRTHTARNRAQRSELRTALKKVRGTEETKDMPAARLEAMKLLDRAGRKGLIHPNTAARYKSRIAKAGNKK
jgi:small subunit ribosomal protein S20